MTRAPGEHEDDLTVLPTDSVENFNTKEIIPKLVCVELGNLQCCQQEGLQRERERL